MEDLERKFTHIKGWGIDADPENEPTYPMKDWTGDDHNRSDYERAVQQPIDVEVLHSNERPDVTRVFGTSSPPEGLSGSIRRFAFKYSESDYMHWLPLVLADRVNMVEGIIDDLKSGKVPNIFAERGWQSEWKHNRTQFIGKVAVAAALATAFFVVLSRSRKNVPTNVMEEYEELV